MRDVVRDVMRGKKGSVPVVLQGYGAAGVVASAGEATEEVKLSHL